MRNSMRPSLQSVAARGLDVQWRLCTSSVCNCGRLYAEPAHKPGPWACAMQLVSYRPLAICCTSPPGTSYAGTRTTPEPLRDKSRRHEPARLMNFEGAHWPAGCLSCAHGSPITRRAASGRQGVALPKSPRKTNAGGSPAQLQPQTPSRNHGGQRFRGRGQGLERRRTPVESSYRFTKLCYESST